MAGWEWDEDNVVSHLPALIHSPFKFRHRSLSAQHFPMQPAPDLLRALTLSILHTPASSTVFACGADTQDGVLTRIVGFVENHC